VKLDWMVGVLGPLFRTQETLEAYTKDNALVVKFDSQETSFATGACLL
jgi:hypothetical protein